MKRTSAAFFVSVCLFSTTVFAQFTGGMTCGQVQTAVQAQVAEGKSAAAIAKAAMAAGVDVECLTRSMILADLDPSAVIQAVIREGGTPATVISAALGAGTSAGTVRAAALAAGVSETIVANAIADFTNRTRIVGTPNPAGPTSLGGGGTASTR